MPLTAPRGLRERTVTVDGARVRYRTAGEGDPVVLVHGLSGSARWWAPVLPALTACRAIHLVELPGFGRFRPGGSRFALTRAPSWLGAWLDAARLERPAVVGHSMGAAIALRLAASRGAPLERLVLIAPAGVPVGRSLLGYALPLAAALGRIAVPTLVVVGERDTLTPLAAAEAVRAGVPSSRLVVLPGAGQVPMFDRPDAFADALLAFLDGRPVGE